MFSVLFMHSYRKTCDTLVFIAQNRINKEDFSKLSTGKIPVSSGPVDFLNRSGLVRIDSFLPDRFQLWDKYTKKARINAFFFLNLSEKKSSYHSSLCSFTQWNDLWTKTIILHVCNASFDKTNLFFFLSVVRLKTKRTNRKKRSVNEISPYKKLKKTIIFRSTTPFSKQWQLIP